MKKEIATHIVFITVIACFAVPLVKWYITPELTQMEIFVNTWLWPLYGVIVYLFGFTAVKTMYDES